MLINSYSFGNVFAGAAGLYSTRRMRPDYQGNAIQVRRSSDDTTQNIGFDGNGNLDTAALASFVGANNGFVTTWYDQSGNGRNVTQGTAGNQPQIVSSGSLITKNSKPSLYFNNGPYLSGSISLGTITAFTAAVVAFYPTGTTQYTRAMGLYNTADANDYQYANSIGMFVPNDLTGGVQIASYYNNGSVIDSGHSVAFDTLTQITNQANGSNMYMRVESSQVGTSVLAFSAAPNTLFLGSGGFGGGVGGQMTGYLSEVALFTSYFTPTAVESNQQTYFGT